MSARRAIIDTDALIIHIGREILRDPHYRFQDWSGVALIGNMDRGGQSMHGYVYRPDGSWCAAVPDDPGDRILHCLQHLQFAMAEEFGLKWHQCLIQLVHDEQAITIHFEYDDPTRWSVTSAGLHRLVEQVRPGADAPAPASSARAS